MLQRDVSADKRSRRRDFGLLTLVEASIIACLVAIVKVSGAKVD